MSEPMSAGEIEDVLASIRRLVSQDARARPQPAEPPSAAPASPGKLILTPALRVVEPSHPIPPAPGVRDDGEAAQDPPGDDHPAAAPAPDAPSQAAAVAATIARLVPDWEEEPAPATRLSWVEVAESLPDADDAPPRFVHRATAQPSQPSPRQDPADEPALIGITDDVLDEAVLREIVREVLREELQGHLGERITRNIRKLVRAEVQRSLTLRDCD
jgi:hypothetical protein